MIDVLIEDDRWSTLDLARLARRAEAAVLGEMEIDPARAETSLLACDDARIAGLNGEFRGRAAPTNVLSWPAADLSPDDPGGRPHPPEPDPGGDIVLGDIALSFDTCAREVAAAGIPAEDHVGHLIVHGLLHLLGYDHVRDADAARMEALEIKILTGLGVRNPYILPDGA
ncbi:MAG: rRNA maturation RNase YbeY [Marinibacterium sp.]